MKKLLLFSLFFFCLSLFVVKAQTSSDPTDIKKTGSFSLMNFVSDKVKISGDLGSFGELYSVSGKVAQRPNQSGRLFFRPSISLWDKVTINFDLFLSTEGNGAKQDINTVKFNPEWSWGRFYYGDFSLQLSKFSLTDVNINGYGIELFPGILKFSFVSGKSQKAVASTASASMYERTIYGGKLGLGDEGGSHFHINFLRAYDNIKSLSRNIFQRIDTTSVSGTSRVDTNYTGVTPSENLIAGTNWGLVLFNKVFRIKGETTVSVFTQDLYSKAIDNKDLPKNISKYYTPRLTTSADIAFEGEMSIRTPTVNVLGGYTMVGPGYTSLGMGSLINDRQIIKGGLGLNLFQGNFTINTTLQKQNDNVANQKLFTTERNNFGIMLSVRPTNELSVSLNTNLNKIGNNATNDTIKIDNTASSFGLNSTYMFEGFSAKNTVNVGYSMQNSEAKSALRGNAKVVSNNIQLGLNSIYSKKLSSGVAIAISSVDQGARGTFGSNTFTGRVNYRMFDEKLNTGLSYTLVSADASTSNVLGMQASYQVFQQSAITFQSRATFFKGKGTNAISFTEFSNTLDWSYRF